MLNDVLKTLLDPAQLPHIARLVFFSVLAFALANTLATLVNTLVSVLLRPLFNRTLPPIQRK